MKKLGVLLGVAMALIVPAISSAQVDPYLQTVAYAQAFNCAPGNGAWRLDEISRDPYGSYTDPYAYGYYDTSSSYGFNQLSQSPYAYTEPLTYAQAPSYGTNTGGSTYNIAAANLAAAQSTQYQVPTYAQYQPVSYTAPQPTYVTQQVQYVPVTERATRYAAPASANPSCRLTPVYADNDTILLKWTTNYATTAFIDNGIGHVSLGSGNRVVTPNGSLTYTMTVVNESGASAQCMAKIIMEGQNTATIPNATQTLPADSAAQNQTQTTGTTSTTGSVVNSAIDTTSNAAEGATNAISSIFSGLQSGGSMWDKIRSVSLVAIVLIVILGIIVFVMRSVFGGGGEGGH